MSTPPADYVQRAKAFHVRLDLNRRLRDMSLGALEIEAIDKISGEDDKRQDGFVDNRPQCRRPNIVCISRYTHEKGSWARAQSKEQA